jgi:DNA polymerase I-like protein with 3'-5' exonuclease and polymerase domains
MEFPRIQDADFITYDTETTGLVYPRDEAFSFGIALPDNSWYYYDLREEPQAGDWISETLENSRTLVICHNSSFDYRMSHTAGIQLPIDRLRDTVINACNINEHETDYSLDSLARKYTKRRKDSSIYAVMADLFGGLPTRNVQMARIARAPSEVVGPYCGDDCLATLDLWRWQLEEIERQGLHDIINFEHSLLPRFIQTEMHGVRVDTEYADEAASRMDSHVEELQKKLNRLAGREVNTNSVKQIREIFEPREVSPGTWQASDGTIVGTTEKGQPSFKSEYLREMKDEKAGLILEIRSGIKTSDTFLRKHVIEHSINGRVYPTINQNKGEEGGTGTGRLSYQNPALQQIPSRNKKVAAIVKPCFLPDEGQVWVDADMASFEVRIFAHLVNDPGIIAAYQEDPQTDFHQYVADIANLVRNATYSGQPNAKQLNLSMIFNSGDGAIADKMGMPWDWESFIPRGKGEEDRITYKKAGPEAMEVINKYHRRLPGVRKLQNSAKKKALSRGYVFTKRGRRLRFPRGYKAYKASGILIQATAADYNKENWQIIGDVLDGEGRLLLNTHDSYGMSMPENWQPLYERVRREIENTSRARVPLVLDLSGSGPNWWEAVRKE